MYSESNLLENVITKHDSYIKSETLCEKIEKADSLSKVTSTEITIGHEKILIGLTKIE